MGPVTRATPDRQDAVTSASEVRAAIERLSNADYAKLMLIARSFAKARIRGSVVEAQDLLQDALVKTLDGRRTWNREVSILKHLDRVMESDAGHVAERQAAQAASTMVESTDQRASSASDPSDRLVVRQELDDCLSLFDGDVDALKVLHLKGEGLSASEIRQELGISRTDYDTVTKRIRRRIAKHLSEGGP